MLKNFVRLVCECKSSWTASSFIERLEENIRQKVKDSHVICAVSGGVDSTVLAALLHRAIGDKLHCIHIDNGLMRLNESL
jgi:GMP synthase (glutamine-hydrolysing)